jgi:hypothetical protein
MKYFTPELYSRLQDMSSDKAMDAADAAWEQARQRYHRSLKRLMRAMPRGLAFLLENFYLHDADVLSMGQEGKQFVIVLRLDVPPRELLVLNYRLTAKALINTTALPFREGCHPVQWMYDEVGLVRGKKGPFMHSLLLSNGWEVVLRLSDIDVFRGQTVYPVPGTNLVPVPAAVSQPA